MWSLPYLWTPAAWCRCLACKHNCYHLVWGTVHRRLKVHTNSNPNRLDCVGYRSFLYGQSPILSEYHKDNNLVYTHHSASATMYTTDHAPVEFWRCSCAGLVNIHEVTLIVIVTLSQSSDCGYLRLMSWMRLLSRCLSGKLGDLQSGQFGDGKVFCGDCNSLILIFRRILSEYRVITFLKFLVTWICLGILLRSGKGWGKVGNLIVAAEQLTCTLFVL